MTTLYEDLDVTPESTPEEIKKAYRKKARESHPDQGGDPEEFKKISKAYEILSDTNRRERYDSTGQTEPENDLDPKIRMIIRSAFLNSDTPIRHIRGKLKSALHEVEDQRSRIKEVIKTLQKRLEKFLEKNTSELVVETIEGAIAEKEHEAEQLTKGLDGVHHIIKFFEEFEAEDKGTNEQNPYSKLEEILNSFHNRNSQTTST